MLRQIEDHETLAIFQSNYIPDDLFNFYVFRTKVYHDGTCLWSINVELNGDSTRHMTLKTVHGTKNMAINKLKEMLSYKNTEGV